MSDPVPVRLLREGRYAVVGELGAGSQAETLDAVDKQAGRAVAIKRFQVRGARSWKDVELAEREARVLSALSHANLPVYIEHFEEEGALYLVMEKIEGETLSSLRRRRATLSSAEIACFFRDAAAVLGYLHARAPAIIHRDIKPGNVIRRADGSFAFVDFGSVRDQLKPEGGSTVVGTFGYMAPEQFQGRALPGSDVYAVAATALALITGREPEDLPHRGLAIDVPAALGKGADPWLVRALSLMLEPNPDKRPAKIVAPPVDHVTSRNSATSSQAQSEQRRQRAREADPRRASQWPRGGEADRQRASQWPRGDTWDWYANREQSRKQRREERRQARDESWRFQRDLKDEIRSEARRVRRHARDFRRSQRAHFDRRGRGLGPLGPLVLSVVVLALTVARLGTFALFRMFLPVLLGLLGLFFGRALRRAAGRCRDVGIAGDRGLLHAIDVVRARLLNHVVEVEGEPVPDYASETPPQTDYAASPWATPKKPEPTRSTGARVSQTARVRIDSEFGQDAESAGPDVRDYESDSPRRNRA